MPAVSKAQQAYMAIAEHAPSKLRGPKPDMTKRQFRDFSKTGTKGLPAKAPKSRAQRVADFERMHGDKEMP